MKFIKPAETGYEWPDLSRLYFFLVFAVHFGFLFYYQKEWILGGEMWAEMATNYFPNSHSQHWLVRLFSLDSGYIPLPQRIISLLVASLGFSVWMVPYAYGFAAFAFATAMVAVFCLKPFRNVVESDVLRFLVACCILLSVDFESRTYINFTYFVAFFAVVLSVLCCVDTDNPPPWYVYSLPFWMLSKPAVLAALPMVILAGMLCKSSFRMVAVASTLVSVVQVLILKMNQADTGFAPKVAVSGFDAVLAAFYYGIGFLAKFAISVDLVAGSALKIGGALLVASLLLAWWRRGKGAGFLILGGLSLIFGNMLINCFAISNDWGLDMSRLNIGNVYRHLNVAFFGSVLVVAGVVCAVFGGFGRISIVAVSSILTLGVFSYWVYHTEQLLKVGQNMAMPPFPLVHASHWQGLSDVIDSDAPVCVPVNPYGWVYKRNCLKLGREIDSGTHLFYDEVARFTVAPVDFGVLPHSKIFAVSLVAKSLGAGPELANLQLAIHLRSGETRREVLSGMVHPTGSLLYLRWPHALVQDEIQGIEVSISGAGSLAQLKSFPGTPAMSWYGLKP